MREQFIIGVTGHRDIIITKRLEDDVCTYLKSKIDEHQDKDIILLSPLAEGADRFVANIFLELQKRYSQLYLFVPMPFSKEHYIKEFHDTSKEEFERLLSYVDKNFVVPKDENQSAYLALGIYVVDECDELLALWDGRHNGKIGGTGDIVAYACTKRHLVHFSCLRQNEI
jgi:uncharacterized phage-like protein YoqJ